MSIDKADPRLTAYALGDGYAWEGLSPEERRAFEAELLSDPEALREIEGIRATAQKLQEELAEGAPLVLGREHRAKIAAAAASAGGGSGAAKPNAVGTASPNGHAAGEDSANAKPHQPGRPMVKPDAEVTPLAPRRRKVLTWLASAALLGSGGLALLALFAVPTASRKEAATAVEAPMDAKEGEAHPPMASALAESPYAPLAVAPMKREEAPGAARAKLRGSGTMQDAREPTPSKPAAAAPFENEQGRRYALRAPRAPSVENPFVSVAQDPRSTFSIDVDTAAYSRVRSDLENGQLPPPDSVRIEELINYFRYDYPKPFAGQPFAVSNEVAQAPWAPQRKLVRIGIQGQQVAAATRPRANLVFLIDVSGSMGSPEKLPLLQHGLKLLAQQLDEGDRVSIVVYAGASGLVLPPTAGNQQETILGALERLSAGGSTNGGEGIQLAYQQAQESFIGGGVNRVILATDGDFNVGITDQQQLVSMIQERARGGVFLSVLGFGRSYNDSMLERLADQGNGNYAYIDSEDEVRKVLVEQATGTLITIAKDVKIQVEFNPQRVESFRLIGYENRQLAHRDFTDDTKDAGEIGAGHTVTALYEIVPKGGWRQGPGSMLRYQESAPPSEAAYSGELLNVKIRYKEPTGDTSRELAFPLIDVDRPFVAASPDFKFAAAVASFGMILRGSQHQGQTSYGQVLEWAEPAAGADQHRRGFVELVRKAQRLER